MRMRMLCSLFSHGSARNAERTKQHSAGHQLARAGAGQPARGDTLLLGNKTGQRCCRNTSWEILERRLGNVQTRPGIGDWRVVALQGAPIPVVGEAARVGLRQWLHFPNDSHLVLDCCCAHARVAGRGALRNHRPLRSPMVAPLTSRDGFSRIREWQRVAEGDLHLSTGARSG